MNRRLLLLFVSIVITFAVKAQATYSLSFNVGDYSLRTSGGLLSVFSSKTDERAVGGEHAPDLPYYPLRILLPAGCTDISYTAVYSDSLVSTGVTMTANSTAQVVESILTSPTAATIDGPNHVVYQGIRDVGRYRYAYFLVSPFTYHLQSHKLYYSHHVGVSLSNYITSYTSGPTVYTDDVNLPSWFNNPDDGDVYYSDFHPFPDGSQIDYLIITKESIISNFERLRRWKSTKGLRVAVVRLEFIYNHYQGSTNQEKIKRCIEDYYHIGTRFVLLGGDDTVVPAKFVKAKCGNYISTSPCDLYYSCFNGDYNWDGNHNGVCGELDDNIDLKPQVYVTRLPVRTGQQILDYTDKLIRYEKTPQQVNYLCRLLDTGYPAMGLWGSVGAGYNGNDARYYLNKVYDDYIQPWWGGNRYYLFKDQSNLVGGSTYFLTAANLEAELNKGYHYVHEYSHGDIDKWCVPGNYSISNASAQTNDNTSLVVTNACYTNAFDEEPCLSEALLRNPDGGALAYFGSSRYGFGDSSGKIRYSVLYDALFFYNLFRGFPLYNRNFGAVAAETKRRLVDDSETESYPYRWLQFTINPMGDPEMPIYTTNPSTFGNVSLSISGSSVTIGTGGVDKCTIAVTSASDYGLSYLESSQDETMHTFQNVPQEFTVCITRHDYIPYLVSLTLGGQPLNDSPLIVSSAGDNVFEVSFGDGTSVERDVEMSSDGVKTVVVSDLATGQVMLTEKTREEGFTINATGWKRGAYVLRVSSSDSVRTAKILVR